MRQQSPQALVLTGPHGYSAGVISRERCSAVEQTLTVLSMIVLQQDISPACTFGHVSVRADSTCHQLHSLGPLKGVTVCRSLCDTSWL